MMEQLYGVNPSTQKYRAHSAHTNRYPPGNPENAPSKNLGHWCRRMFCCALGHSWRSIVFSCTRAHSVSSRCTETSAGSDCCAVLLARAPSDLLFAVRQVSSLTHRPFIVGGHTQEGQRHQIDRLAFFGLSFAFFHFGPFLAQQRKAIR
ncbi:unnamed protein product [Ectocarpus sp. 8 AP-2014]